MFTRTRWIRLVCASVVLLLGVTGCFRRGPELAPVTGTVTLDGEPLAGAQVEFKPMRGNPSYGTTDQLGRYELKYTKDKTGGVVGSHVVRITTQTTAVDPETGSEIQVPQGVPERYNERSQLIREVKPGENQIHFALTSEPKTEETGVAEAKAKEGGAEEPKIEGREREDADTQTPATQKPAARAPESASPDTENAAAEPPDTPKAKAEQPAAEES
ncbi:MAG TPA: hypothetical protein VMY37_37335 [Thermoguttaceae bacterium]|nr:hypothetical protein [Thermoguttaceae bacterium]